MGDLMRGGRDNAFNLLRLSAALLVFLSHEHLVTGKPLPIQGYFGVYVFFIISGFLIARSWDQRSSTFQYLKNRGLRILPGLWTVVLLTIFVIGPLATDLPLSRYFADSHTWKYLLNLVFDLQLTLPGVFVDNPYPIVNTPLWTLAHEAIFYVTLAALGSLFRLHMRHVVLAVYLSAMLLQSHDSSGVPSDLISYFFGGAVVWYFREYIVFNK
ncbi:MAG: acyltransferase [Nevskia sp.]|nr:acyltransferase [Nevskia sp.]